ncbi:molybdenum cofactor guanylyltransferase MobA [Paracoccus sp. Z330]|uniref:Molybdenum cofactor guanylyltransferase n=1 Tax=Paracoccus onchidii TaxID=3017813 RepID=A0ABT4ZCV6_9RHOB|nr:molybdenum cofactor guanylyltransferase MobA [Paracoccus onchidii]MDB6177193.1 molybdenum cofactor guanylyltransferase MobA [Paracoccus onchidii]
MTRFPAIILAGGRSSRMGGGDKGLLALNGKPIIGHVIDRLARQCQPLLLSANGDPQHWARFGLPILPDDLPDRPGPLAGILAGLDWAAGQGHDAIVSAAADTPFLPDDLVARLATGRGPEGLALAATRTRQGLVNEHPTFGLWPVSIRARLRARLMQGQRRVRDLARVHGATLVIWDESAGYPFFNINTPDDLHQARAHAQGFDCP